MNEKKEDILVIAINVPETCLYLKEHNCFVEIRARLAYWDEEEPQFFVEMNNLNLTTAQNIMWDEFSAILEQFISQYYKNQKNDSTNGSPSSLRDEQGND